MIDPTEQAKKRPANYDQLSAQEQWDIDKELGILDWDGTDVEVKVELVSRDMSHYELKFTYDEDGKIDGWYWYDHRKEENHEQD